MTNPTRRPARIATRVALLAATIALLGPAAPSLAATGPLFAAGALPAVPAGAAAGTAQSATFTSISCPAAGDCVAGGSYRTSAGGQLAMIETETDGAWSAPQRVVLPSGATTTGRNADATIDSVSCAVPGFCVAVGSYRGSGNGTLVVTESGGTWSTATTVPSVSGEITGGGVLDSVSCPSVGECVAVGTSATSGGLDEPTIVTETSGTWSKPVLPALPSADVRTVPTSLSVSCPAVGDYVVAGTDYPSSGPQLPMVIAEAGGRWQPADPLGPLSGALADADQVVSLTAIDCAAVGHCTAVGNEETGSGASGFALIDSNGSFSEVGLPYPAGSAGFLPASAGLGLDAVGCADPADCAAAGAYPTAGTPAQPEAAAMTAVEDGGIWTAPTELAPQGDAAPSASGVAAVRALSCPAAGMCEGAGGYVTATGQQLPMVVVSVPVLAVVSAPLPAARLGHPYTAQLAASGGSGAATWSVSAGSLPVGLALDPGT